MPSLWAQFKAAMRFPTQGGGGRYSSSVVRLDENIHYNVDFLNSEWSRLDYGVEAGLGFNFYFPSFIFSPEIKISNGLRNIHSRDELLKYSNVLDRIQSRQIIFSIHLEG